MGKYLITMDNSENKNCATLELDNTFERFMLNREARNLSEDTLNEYRKNYGYFCEFLDYLEKHCRRSNSPMRPSLQRNHGGLYLVYAERKKHC